MIERTRAERVADEQADEVLRNGATLEQAFSEWCAWLVEEEYDESVRQSVEWRA